MAAALLTSLSEESTRLPILDKRIFTEAMHAPLKKKKKKKKKKTSVLNSILFLEHNINPHNGAVI